MAPTKHTQKLCRSFITGALLLCAASLTGCAGQGGASSSAFLSPQIKQVAVEQHEKVLGFDAKIGLSGTEIDKVGLAHFRAQIQSVVARSKDFWDHLEDSKIHPEKYGATLPYWANTIDKLKQEKDPYVVAAVVNAMVNSSGIYDNEQAAKERAAQERGETPPVDRIKDIETFINTGEGICGESGVARAIILSKLLGPENVKIIAGFSYDPLKKEFFPHLVCGVSLPDKNGKMRHFVLENGLMEKDAVESIRLDGDVSKAVAELSARAEDIPLQNTLVHFGAIKASGRWGASEEVTAFFPNTAVSPDGTDFALFDKIGGFNQLGPFTWFEAKSPESLGKREELIVRPSIENYLPDIAAVSVLPRLMSSGSNVYGPKDIAKAMVVFLGRPTEPSANGIRLPVGATPRPGRF